MDNSPPTRDGQDVAARFVAARLAATPLAVFPGKVPDTLEAAYRTQDAAIELWPDSIAGWKVGRVPPALEDTVGCDRLAGPIFASTIFGATGNGTLPMAIFDGGFAAVEAEFVAVIGRDAPADKQNWSLDETSDMIGDLRIGLEIASSPLVTINELGPAVVVSDFGNNAGLIVGPSIRDWCERDPRTLACETVIDGKPVGSGGAFGLTGGFQRSVQFMLENAAARGRPLQKGMMIATGQTTGIHDVRVGQRAAVHFGDDGTLECLLVAAQAVDRKP